MKKKGVPYHYNRGHQLLTRKLYVGTQALRTRRVIKLINGGFEHIKLNLQSSKWQCALYQGITIE